MWSDFDKRGEKTFAGVIDFPSKIDADRQKKTDEATKFKAGGEVIFTPDNMAQDKEKELQKAGVKFTKTKVA